MAAGLLAAAWAFPALTHALRVDEILPWRSSSAPRRCSASAGISSIGW
ncbi:hypothetical protein ACFQ9X_56000 [Catenulispora yoronensis]